MGIEYELKLMLQIILVAGIVMVAIRQHFIYEGQKKRDAEDNERRKRDLIWTMRAPWQELAQIYREVDERERQMEEEFQARKWSFVHTYCPELEADMTDPTAGELKRALALPQHQAVRDMLIGWERDGSLGDPFGNFQVALSICRRWEDWKELPGPEDSYLGYSKDHVREALQAWLKVMAREADRNFHADAMDKALPPPAPAVPSTRGRF